MMRLLLAPLIVIGIAAAQPVQAQKSADTLRIAISDQIRSLDPYYNPITDANFFYSRIYDTLVSYDTRERKFVPQVAKSWKRISTTVLEFEIRDDLVFHSGNQLTVDDVVESLNWVSNPDNKVPSYQRYYGSIKNLEKTGPSTVRVNMTTPDVTDILTLALRGWVYDSKLYRSYPDRSDYGRKTPVGTGPYKVVKLDTNSTIVVERYEKTKTERARAPIARIHGLLIPDQQTQIAQLLVGQIDVVKNVNSANAESLATNQGFVSTSVDSLTFGFLSFDALGRSGKKELMDQRVREALTIAINRNELLGVVPGKERARLMENMCFRETLGCAYSRKIAAYDPARAKKLLSDAGYANGFDLTIFANSQMGDIAKAVAGYWRQAGVRADVQIMPTTVLRKKSMDGETTVQANFVPNDNLPDVNQPLRLVFGNDNRDYSRDPLIVSGMEAGDEEFDPDKRRVVYQNVFDHIVDKSYAVPLVTMPALYSHTREVRILPNAFTDSATVISDFSWN